MIDVDLEKEFREILKEALVLLKDDLECFERSFLPTPHLEEQEQLKRWGAIIGRIEKVLESKS
jgi:hypothetical protein